MRLLLEAPLVWMLVSAPQLTASGRRCAPTWPVAEGPRDVATGRHRHDRQLLVGDAHAEGGAAALGAAQGAVATRNAPVASVRRVLDLPGACGPEAASSVPAGWLLRRPRKGDQSFRPETEPEPEEQPREQPFVPDPTGTAW
mmetsp:Transcript_28625/g.56010  ORF Transcript_28625/g.56010 Transcript_28625/m.56010 type:complete len:142 (-) Transcript_28625:429-854(-)